MTQETSHPLKPFIVVTLIAVSVWSWLYVFVFYREHKADIILAAEDVARTIALPYHIAHMSALDPIQELPVPVHGVALSAIGDTWGAARAEGRTHEGTDVFAPRGTPVFSATRGYVVRRNIGSIGGVNVMIIGPGGVRYYYAHLDRIADGVERGVAVTPDTVLGFVGNSGNAATTPPHLHFGVYEGWRHPINPYPLLVDR